MVKRTTEPSLDLEWNPKSKESWLVEFEKRAVNDDKWSCAVTAAIQAEVQGEECIQIFAQCAATGMRKAIKTITMSDVIALLKESNEKIQTNKKENQSSQKEKSKRKASIEKPKSTHSLPVGSSSIIELASKYAEITDLECRLPPDLMAALLKDIILKMKEESILQKKTLLTERYKERRKKIETTFIQSLKPFEIRGEKKSQNLKTSSNVLGLREPIDDEPYEGPDLYIVLIDFYDPFYFPELIRINVPFIALVKVSHIRESGKWSHTSVPEKSDATSKKATIVSQFWKTLKENSVVMDKTQKFKDIAMMQYQTPMFKPSELRQQIYKVVFNEMSWMLYSAYRVYRQHQNYLRDMLVQRTILSLEPLKLDRCGVYNKLCDALVTGEPNTPLLVLYAIIEQVVAGVPHTESMPLEYEPQVHDFYKIDAKAENDEEDAFSKKNEVRLVTPCQQCRGKQLDSVCGHLEELPDEKTSSEKGEWFDETSDKRSSTAENSVPAYGESSFEYQSDNNLSLSESLIAKVLLEKNEEEYLKSKKVKPPKMCLYGDSICVQNYHCDPRLLNGDLIVDRFFKNTGVLRLWTKYPELPPADRAFFKYHFQRLWNVSKETLDAIKLKVFFTISIKLIAMSKSYLYRGDEENVSEMFPSTGREKMKKLSKVRFEHNVNMPQVRSNGKNFSNYFFKTFLPYLKAPKKSLWMNQIKSSILKSDSHNLRKVTSQFNMYLVTHRSSGVYYPYCLKSSDAVNDPFTGHVTDKEFSTLTTLLDCFEISNITEFHFLQDKVDYENLIEGFKFFEKLEPNRMVQVLLEAQSKYNTVQCTYFAPTDTLLIAMYNDFDYRGMFYSYGFGALHTPVSLRDFYNFVYPEINEWLIEEEAEHKKIIKKLLNKEKEKEKMADDKFLNDLKQQYCQMNETNRMKYLETGSRTFEVDVSLFDLPTKPKYNRAGRVLFVGTNFGNIRVETQRNVHEFHSKDGTEVNVYVDSWLYNPLKLLTLVIKKGTLSLFYYQWLGSDEATKSFTLKTSKEVICSFYKKEDTSAPNYKLEMSWPTGLIIQRISSPSLYIKQSYLKVYRQTLDIKNENSRCFLTNGQVVIFREDGTTEVLFGSGAKCIITETQKQNKKPVSKYEITNTVGEIWEITLKEYCHFKKLLTSLKVYIGVDSKTQEVFYKRNDGVYCMLWPSGKLVTNFPDGTKITSIPDFDEEDITGEWSEETNSQALLEDPGSNWSTGFVSVSCSYLIEHPNYSRVHITPKSIQLSMPEELTISMTEDGVYELRKDEHTLNVQSNTIEFYSSCSNCENKSIATLTPDSSEVLFRFNDFENKIFSIQQNGIISFQDNDNDLDDSVSECEFKNGKDDALGSCNHIKTINSQRCFALERNLSGFEFIHSKLIANYCYDLPEETYYELDSKSPDGFMTSHLFSSSHSRIGYENWIMNYAKNDSLPTNLRRLDLREQKQKESQRKFSYEKNTQVDTEPNSWETKTFKMPKMIVTRIVKCFNQEPTTIISDLQKYVFAYQKQARDICDKYRSYKSGDSHLEDPRYVKMRLRKIALTLCQNLNPYPHLCSQVPSTEKEIHYFGHLIKSADDYKDHVQDDGLLPDCKQIPKLLPKIDNFESIPEENESLSSSH